MRFNFSEGTRLSLQEFIEGSPASCLPAYKIELVTTTLPSRRKVLFQWKLLDVKMKLLPISEMFVLKKWIGRCVQKRHCQFLSILHLLTVALFGFLLLTVVHYLFSLPSAINNTEISFLGRTVELMLWLGCCSRLMLIRITAGLVLWAWKN